MKAAERKEGTGKREEEKGKRGVSPFPLPFPSSPSPLAAGADEAIEWLRRIVAGERIWIAVDKAGEETVRAATGDETMAACDKLLKYGTGVKETPAAPPDDTGARLDRLSPEDLATMRSIAGRAYVDSPPA